MKFFPSLARALPIAVTLSLAACATPEGQLRAGLANAGLSDGMATCMARDMTPRLSIKQLLRLRSLAHVSDRDPRKTSIDAYLHQVRALQDGEIWVIASRAAARCALEI